MSENKFFKIEIQKEEKTASITTNITESELIDMSYALENYIEEKIPYKHPAAMAVLHAVLTSLTQITDEEGLLSLYRHFKENIDKDKKNEQIQITYNVFTDKIKS